MFLLFMAITAFLYSQNKSYKRGVGYGYHSVADMNTASKGISWWYNWAAQPDVAIRNTYADYNVDFTPQAWNAAEINGVSTWVSQDDKIKYLLGFNEPNFKAQANMTPTQAAAAWPQLQAIADQYDLKLVSPAVNYCGDCVSENGKVYYSPFDWLDDFFASCAGCRVDFIALHWYGGGNSMTGYIDDARKYGKPIWITEFANWEAGVTPAGQKSYLAGTTNFLERDPDVYRYSWFIGRGPGENTYPYIDLYGANGEMTDLGQLYLDIPVYDSTFVNEVPGKIEAEEYYLQSGIFAELTNDADGFMNIGYTDAGDWVKYKISVADSGTYQFTTRYAGTAVGKFDLYVDDIKKGTVNTSNTNNWQSWASVTNSIRLETGEHVLKLVVVVKGFNLNWLSFAKGSAGISDLSLHLLKADVYPNPVTENEFKIIFQNNCPDILTIQIVDLTGKTLLIKKFENIIGNEIRMNLGDIPEINKGMYTLMIRSKAGYTNKKIVLF
jgi:hypothetical protein